MQASPRAKNGHLPASDVSGVAGVSQISNIIQTSHVKSLFRWHCIRSCPLSVIFEVVRQYEPTPCQVIDQQPLNNMGPSHPDLNNPRL